MTISTVMVRDDDDVNSGENHRHDDDDNKDDIERCLYKVKCDKSC